MNIQFSIQPDDPLRVNGEITVDQWKILRQPGDPFIIERDKDCPVDAFIRTIDSLFPGIRLPCIDQNPRYYRVYRERKNTAWSGVAFIDARALTAVQPCAHLFRVNRHGEIYAYEVPK